MPPRPPHRGHRLYLIGLPRRATDPVPPHLRHAFTMRRIMRCSDMVPPGLAGLVDASWFAAHHLCEPGEFEHVVINPFRVGVSVSVSLCPRDQFVAPVCHASPFRARRAFTAALKIILLPIGLPDQSHASIASANFAASATDTLGWGR